MNYQQAISYIENTGKFGINLGLQRIERLCSLLGNPEKNLKIIHVAGTNGKGSTTTFISSILKEQGYRVGIYTSPYIERFTERIRVNEQEISEQDIATIVTELVPLVQKLVQEGFDPPTEFELITAAAFRYFHDQKVDYVVLEVGLGGRYDATNVITPMLSVITTISYDHTNILGDTLGKIAYEKAGIIKHGVPVVVYPQEIEAMDVIKRVSEEQAADIYLVDASSVQILSDTIDGIQFNVSSRKGWDNLKIRLLGEHQVMNALTALTAITLLPGLGCKVSDEAIHKGLEHAAWPGRFEILQQNPYIVLDGGHNLQGIHALVKAANCYFNEKRIRIVCGMLKDKDYDQMLETLFQLTDEFVTVTPDNPRALSSQELSEWIKGKGRTAISSSSIADAVEKGMQLTEPNDVLLFCGSLYMIGAVRTILKNRK